MKAYESILLAASQLPVGDRLRLIDELSATFPDDHPATLSDEWLAEIDRRSLELDSGTAKTESWSAIRKRLFRQVGLDRAD